MLTARIMVAAVGIILPYAARWLRGPEWLAQYTDTGFIGFVLFGLFNGIAWGSVLVASIYFRHALSIVFPAASGFGFLVYGHWGVDLVSDAQAGLALLVIPVFAVPFVAVGGVVGYLLERSGWWEGSTHSTPPPLPPRCD